MSKPKPTSIGPISSERKSNFELLRLVLMFMIIFHHSIVHGLGLSSIVGNDTQETILSNSETIIAILLNGMCICAVNCFILISGYFSIKTTLHKFSSILFSTLFYTVAFSTTFDIFNGSIAQGLLRIFIFSHETYWFINAYLLLMIVAPLLNNLFENMSHRYLNYFLIFLIFVSIYLGFVWGSTYNYNGYNLFQFVTLYCIGRFIRVRNIKSTRIFSISLYLFGSISTGIIASLLWSYGFSKWSWHMTFYNNPLLIIAALGLFLLFRSFNIRSRFINSCASSCLAIYMIQSSLFASALYYAYIKLFVSNWGGVVWFCIPIFTVVIMAISILFDQLTQKKINNSASNIILQILNRVSRRLNSVKFLKTNE